MPKEYKVPSINISIIIKAATTDGSLTPKNKLQADITNLKKQGNNKTEQRAMMLLHASKTKDNT